MANHLTPAQQQVARVLARAVGPHGFVMAGGSALNAAGLSDRLSNDIDAFSSTCIDVAVAAAAARTAFEAAGWEVRDDRTGPVFCRLVVTTGRRRQSQVVVELGQDTILWGTQETSVGPALSVRELAANKVLAAFGRLKPRDLCDLHALSSHVSVSSMLRDARLKDEGFDVDVLAEMVERTGAKPDREWPPGVDIEVVRSWSRGFVAEAVATDVAELARRSPDGPEPDGDGWVRPYRRSDGTVVGGYRRRPRR